VIHQYKTDQIVSSAKSTAHTMYSVSKKLILTYFVLSVTTDSLWD